MCIVAFIKVSSVVVVSWYPAGHLVASATATICSSSMIWKARIYSAKSGEVTFSDCGVSPIPSLR